MNILHTVENYSPSTGGMQEVVKQISEKLVDLGHEVTVATSKNPDRISTKMNDVKIKEFDISGNYVLGIKGETSKYIEFVKNEKFDVMTNFAAQQWATDLLLTELGDIKSKKVFVPTGFSGLYRNEYKDYFNKMKSWMKNYDLNIFLSNDYRDINFARKIGIGINKIKVIPNGASKKEFDNQVKYDIRKKLNIPYDHFLVLHVGSHTGVKGHKEAIAIFKKAEIPGSTFLIIGNSFGRGCTKYCRRQSMLSKITRTSKKIIVKSMTREETIAAYKEADVFLFPSNIECSPIVLFEACASKTPFLTTDVGNSKEIIEWTKGGKLLPTRKDNKKFSYAKIDESVKLLREMYKNTKLRDRLAQNGFENWRKNYTWEKIAKDYEKIYLNLI